MKKLLTLFSLLISNVMSGCVESIYNKGDAILLDERGIPMKCQPMLNQSRNPPAMPMISTAPTQILRYYNPRDIDYFYTQDPSEMGFMGKPPYFYQLIAFRLHQRAMPGLTRIYRYYSAVHKDHFYTTDPKEIGIIRIGQIGNYGYKREKDLGWAEKTAAKGLLAIHRFYQPRVKSHFYTTRIEDVSGGKRNMTIGAEGKNGYVYEGILAYAHPA